MFKKQNKIIIVIYILFGLVTIDTCFASAANIKPTNIILSNARWTNNELFNFLKKSNQNEICFLSQLNIIQAGQIKPIYFQTGFEEKRTNLKKRAILKKAPSSLPFVREIVYTTRIDRTQTIEIEFSVYIVSLNSQGEIIKAAPKELYLSLHPSKDELKKLPLKNGKLFYQIPASESYHHIRFRILGGIEHDIQLMFMNNKKPFTAEQNKE